jgi:hypothetical protein
MKNNEMICLDYAAIRKQIFHDSHPGRTLCIGEMVKLAIRDEKIVEHLWFEVTRIERFDQYTGHCRTYPVSLTNMFYDQHIHFRFTDVEEILFDERNN